MRTPPAMILLTFAICLPMELRAGQPPVKLSSRQHAEKIAIAEAKSSVVIDIHSQRGIGRATFERTGCNWPDSLTLRLHLRGLESLTLAVGERETRVEAVSDSPGKIDLLVADKDGAALPANSPFRPEVTRHAAADNAATPGCFEVVVPEGLLSSEASQLTVRWIDFYR